MSMKKVALILCVLGFGLAGGVAAEAPAPAAKFALSPCAGPEYPKDALCGTYEVFENRETRKGRKIPLHVVVLPATGPDRLPDPFIFFAGGPGDSSAATGLFVAQDLAALRERRDFLLVDFRGTGKSGGLFCTEFQGGDTAQIFLDEFLSAKRVRACAERLKKEADLTQYTTAAAIDDIDEVRAALGYGKVNLMGGSYGTRAVLVYLRRHPENVRTATMMGVVPTGGRSPLHFARDAQAALEGILSNCAADAACKAAFPNLRDEVAALLRRVEAGPVRVELTDAETGKPVELRLSRAGVAQALRYMLYNPAQSALLPLTVHEAAQGNFVPLAQTARASALGLTTLSDPFFLSVTCAEDVPFIKDEEIPAAVAGTFLGDFRIRAQRAACAVWPAARVKEDFLAPVVSDVPALLVTGELDPVTPPRQGDEVVKTLKRGRHLVVPDGAHGFGGMEGADCFNQLVVSFVEAGTVEGLDTSCVAKVKRAAFPVSFGDPEVQVARADLERLTGSYAAESLTARIDLLGERLRLNFGEREVLLLIPTAPDSFRVEGMGPGFLVLFDLKDGRAASVTLRAPGRPDLVMQRVD